MATLLLALTVFAATGVDMVEALTIVLAVGVTRGWRSALQGAALAVGVLIVVIGVFGTALATRVPLQLLHLIIGLALLIVGLLLSSFGTFWVVAGLGHEWPGSDLAIIAIGAVYAALAYGTIRVLDRGRQPTIPTASSSP